VVQLRRLEATYPHMVVDQRFDTMQRNQNFVEAEEEAEAEEEGEVEVERPVIGGPVVGGPYNINRMRPLRGEERIRFLNEWIRHEVRQEVRREMGEQAEVQAEAEDEAKVEQVPEMVRPTRDPSGNWQFLASDDPYQNWHRMAPNDIRCPQCGDIFSLIEILRLHICELAQDGGEANEAEAEAKAEAEENNNSEDADDNLAVRGVGEGADAVGAANLTASPPEGAARYPNQNYDQNSIEYFFSQERCQRLPAPKTIQRIWQWQPAPKADPEADMPDLE
jgi:hypothetical protein